jgi:hypothetical protein
MDSRLRGNGGEEEGMEMMKYTGLLIIGMVKCLIFFWIASSLCFSQ